MCPILNTSPRTAETKQRGVLRCITATVTKNKIPKDIVPEQIVSLISLRILYSEWFMKFGKESFQDMSVHSATQTLCIHYSMFTYISQTQKNPHNH